MKNLKIINIDDIGNEKADYNSNYLIVDEYAIEPDSFTEVESFDSLVEKESYKDIYLIRNFISNDMNYISNPYKAEDSCFANAQIFLNSYILSGHAFEKFIEISKEETDKSYIYVLRKTMHAFKDKINYGYIKEIGYSSMPFQDASS